MAKNNTESALSEDTLGHLEDVRKGKPRRFVMICKGQTIVSLVVFKKGSVDKYKKEAKEAGSGTVSYGVVDGKGPKINFKLARADGFEKEPTTTAKMKAFLKDEAEFTCNPLIEIVDSQLPMLDADDPLVARFMKLGESAMLACDNYPERAEEVDGSCAEISKILDTDPTADAAYDKIGKLESLLGKLLLAPPPKQDGEPSNDQQVEVIKKAEGVKSRLSSLFGIAATVVKSVVSGASDLLFGSEPEKPVGPEAPKVLDPAAAKFKSQLAEVLKQATPYVPTIGGEIKNLATEARGFADKANYTDANERLKQMLELVAKAKSTPTTSDGKDQTAKFTERVINLKPNLELLKAGDAESKLKASETAALVKQGAGFTQKNEFEEAFSLLTQAEALANTSVKELEERKKKLADAMEMLRSAQRVWQTVKTEATNDLGSIPKDIEEKLAKIETSLKLEKETDPAKIEKVCDESGDALEEIDKAVKELVQEKLAYQSDLELIEGRIKAMEGHTKATVHFIAGKITEIKNQVSAAKVLAGKHEYADAATSLREIAKTSLEAEHLGDLHAEYSSVLDDRDLLVKALPNPAPHVDIGKMITAVKKKFNDAEGHATKNEFDKAVALLNQVPQDCIDTQWAVTRFKEYSTKRSTVDGYIKKRETEPDVVEVGLYLPTMRDLYAKSDYTLTKDFTKSLTLLERAAGINNPMYKAVDQLVEFRKQRKNAEDKITELENHAGKEGIADPIARFKSDLDFADTKKTAHEYVAGTGVCLNIIRLFTDAKKKADECKTYIDRKKEISDKKGTITGAKSGEVAEIVGESDKLVTEAEKFATKKDYVEAKNLLDKAMERCDWAKTTFDNLNWADGRQNDAEASINNLAADFNAAYAKFTGVKTQVTNHDKSSWFSTEVGNAQTKADGARTEATKTPTPDVAAAQRLLREAIADVTKVVFLVDERKAYENMRQSLVNRMSQLKNPVARGSALADEIKAVEDKLGEAKVEADNKKFPAAEAKLTEADNLRQKADELAKFYDEFMAIRDPGVKDAVAAVDTTEGQKGLDKEVIKLKEDLTKADELKTNKKFEDAIKALKKVKADADALKKKLDEYKEALKTEKEKVTDVIGKIKGKPAVKTEYDEATKMQEELKKMFEERRFVEARTFAVRISWVLELGTNMLQRYDKYIVERDKAKDGIDKLKLVKCAAVEKAIETMDGEYGKAEAFAKDRNYESGMPHLETVIKGCVEPTKVGKAYELYAPSLKAAQDGIAALRKDFPHSEAVSLEADGLNGKLTAMQKLAAKKSFADAKTGADEVTKACEEVRKTAAGQKEFDDATQSAASGSKDKVDGMDTEIENLKKLVTKLESRNLGPVLVEELARINTSLKEAEKERMANNAAKARDHLKAAAKECAEANETADQYVQIDKAIKDAANKVDEVRKKYAEPSFIKATCDNLDKELSLARQDAYGKTFSAALNLVASVNSRTVEMVELGELHLKYQDERKKVDPRVETLGKSKARYIIAKELGEIKAYVAESQGKADARDYREAMDLLAKADDLCDGTTLKAEMHEEKEVTPDAIDKILKKPDGDKQLDEIIKTLDPKAQRKVCRVALEKRFNINLELFTDTKGTSKDNTLNKKAPDEVKLYALMQALPKSHTRDNPCLDKVQRLGDEAGTSSYDKYTRVSELRVGRATDKTERIIGEEWQLGEVDPDSKPSDSDPPTKFSWTTLHEIGHSVDDRLSFMKRRGSEDDFGGWKEYSANVGEIAEVAANHFKYEKAYIAAYLAGEKIVPPEPSGTHKDVDIKEWDRRRIEAETWCDSIRSGKSLYYSATATDKSLIGDKNRVYQEAYAGRWVSYLASARKKGVAGYQFRAPGEWFAEIYAAYHTGKMNKAHPARKWLDTLK